MIERLKSTIDKTLKVEFASEISFSKNCNFHSLDDVIKQNWVKKDPTCIPCANGDRKMKFNGKGEFEMNYYFLKSQSFSIFDSPWWCHQPKNVSKRSKLVFHVPMLIERWKSKVEGTLRCIIPLWKRFLKILKFWFSLATSSTQNWLEKGPKSVSHVLMVIERWNSKVKGVLRFFRLWNHILEILKF